MKRIEELNNALIAAWNQDQRVKALKIAIQVSLREIIATGYSWCRLSLLRHSFNLVSLVVKKNCNIKHDAPEWRSPLPYPVSVGGKEFQ